MEQSVTQGRLDKTVARNQLISLFARRQSGSPAIDNAKQYYNSG
jgi:hypothetical protein